MSRQHGETAITALMQRLQAILAQHPLGISEYDILCQLRDSGHPAIPDGLFGNQHILFQAHFIVFHALHRLDRERRQAGEGGIDINPVKIRLLGATSGEAEQMLADHDPLQAYYLNLDNLRDTGPEEVDLMLNRFWELYLRGDERRAALLTLGLQDPVDEADIKQAYRRLAATHHPDRGGDTRVFQEINAAMRVLEKTAPVR